MNITKKDIKQVEEVNLIKTILAMQEVGETRKDIADKLGISTSKLDNLKRKLKKNPDMLDALNLDELEQLEKSFRIKLLKTADKALAHIDPEKLKKSSAYQLAGIAALMFDKYRLASNKSTDNVSVLAQITSKVNDKIIGNKSPQCTRKTDE